MKQYNIIENTSQKYPNGSWWESNSGGKFTIMAKTDRMRSVDPYVYRLIKFEDGTIVEADISNIKIGNVKNPNHPNVHGVGYLGQGKWLSHSNGKATQEYYTWVHMLRRCYSGKFQIKNPSYKGVIVCNRWHCFQNFCEDIQLLEGYNFWKEGIGYELDKDILCEKMNIIPKIYSPETCIFISKSENVSESTTRKNLTGLTYIGVSPDGEEYEFTNQKEFADRYDMNSSLIHACINKKRKSHKGWTFKVKE